MGNENTHEAAPADSIKQRATLAGKDESTINADADSCGQVPDSSTSEASLDPAPPAGITKRASAATQTTKISTDDDGAIRDQRLANSPDQRTSAKIVSINDSKPPLKNKSEETDREAEYAQSGGPLPFDFERPVRIDPETFPDKPNPGSSALPATMANIRFMLAQYGIVVRYNVIKKRTELLIYGLQCIPDNAVNTAWAHVVNLAAINGLWSGQIERYIDAIANQNPYNPVTEWVDSRPWDGVDRLADFIDAITAEPEFPDSLKTTLIVKWLRSAVAAVYKPTGFSARGVLTFQGPQGIGKTTFIRSLIPDEALRESVVKLDHHMDGANKDTIITAATHWIVEIGELDSSYRKDIARLKGIITADTDKVRLPYHRRDSEFPRRTVFCATVNARHFLVDDTGNSRWWTIPVIAMNYQHGIDMQQLWAQVRSKFESADFQWWLTPDEDAALEAKNRDHRAVNTIRERLDAAIDFGAKESEKGFYTATRALQRVGISSPSNRQAQQAGAVMREHFGEPRKRNGISGWLVALKGYTAGATNQQDFTNVDQADDIEY